MLVPHANTYFIESYLDNAAVVPRELRLAPSLFVNAVKS